MKKNLILLLLVASCTGNNIDSKNKHENNLHKLKDDANVFLLTTDKLDAKTRQCYLTSHYYDPSSKINMFINDNGSIGGSVFTQDDNSNIGCNLLPYTIVNNQLNKVSLVGSDAEDCLDRYKCTINILGIDNTNYVAGVFTGGQNISFYADDQYTYVYKTNGAKIISKNINYWITSQLPTNIPNEIYNYNYKNNNYTLIYDKSYMPVFVNDNGDYIAFDKVDKIYDINRGVLFSNIQEFNDLTISNNRQFAYGVNKSDNNKIYKIDINSGQATLLDFHLENNQKIFYSRFVTNTGNLIMILRTQVDTIIKDEIVIYSPTSMQLYKINDVLHNMLLDQYMISFKNDYDYYDAAATEIYLKKYIDISSNDKYMSINTSNIKNLNTLLVKISFDTTLADFLAKM